MLFMQLAVAHRAMTPGDCLAHLGTLLPPNDQLHHAGHSRDNQASQKAIIANQGWMNISSTAAKAAHSTIRNAATSNCTFDLWSETYDMSEVYRRPLSRTQQSTILAHNGVESLS